MAQSNRQYACPAPNRTTTASFTCEYRSTDPPYGYRIRVTGSIYYGETVIVDVSRAVRKARCL